MTLPRIAITTGEPAGIGPEISLAALANADFRAQFRSILIGDGRMLAARARATGIALPLVAFNAMAKAPEGAVEVLDVPLAVTPRAGELERANVAALLKTLVIGIDGALDGSFDAVVTAPIQKSVINEAGIPFTGHTEFETTLRILAADLGRWFGINRPRIVVAGLNPHAGESGVLGREEIEVIEPVLAKLRLEGFDLTGPLPADTLFQPERLKHVDAVLAMYHDQGLPVLKYASFGTGVNITLGLPVIRTSVDHGTALDLAGTGRADAGSMRAAIECALLMHKARRRLA